MSEEDVRAFIRGRNRALRWRTTWIISGFACFEAFVLWLQSRDPDPDLRHMNPALVGLFGVFAVLQLAGAALLFASFKPLRDEAGPLVAHRDLVASVLLSFGVMAGGLASLTVAAWAWPDSRSLILALCGPALLVLGALRVPSVFDRRSVIVVDAEGFFDRRLTRRPVTWDQLGPLRMVGDRATWPVLLVNDPPENRTLLRRVNGWLGFPYLYVAFGGVDRAGGDVLLAIDRFAPRLTEGLSDAQKVRKRP